MNTPDLPVLSPSEAEWRRILTGEGRHLPFTSHGRDLILSFTAPSKQEGTAPHRLPLEIAGEPAALEFQFAPDGCFPSAVPGGIPDQPETLRSAVLAFVCREILDLLGERMNLPVSVSAMQTSVITGSVTLPFMITPPDEDACEAWGNLLLGPKAAGALVSSAVAWPRGAGPLDATVLMECPVVISTVPMSPRDLEELAPGDMILLGTPGDLTPVLSLPGGRSISCRVPGLEHPGDPEISGEAAA